MIKKILMASALAGSLFAVDFNLTNGWHLLGALNDINVSEINDSNVVAVWTYDDTTNSWKAYSNKYDLNGYAFISPLEQIKKGEGYWVLYNAEYDNTDTTSTSTTTAENADYFQYVIDGVSDFTLDDIANKTFTVQMDDGIGVIAFDANGKAQLDSPWGTYYIELDNGTIYAFYTSHDYNETIQFKKVAQNDGGIVAAGYNISEYHNWGFFDFWLLGDEEPVDMNTVLPYYVYDDNGEYFKYETNNTVEYYYYNSANSTYERGYSEQFEIADGKILINQDQFENTWGYLGETIVTTSTSNTSLQIIRRVGRYDVLLSTHTYTSSYVDENLKNKTWNDAIGNAVINSYYVLQDNGTVAYYDYNSPSDQILTQQNDDENITYNIDGNNLYINFDYNNDGKAEEVDKYVLNPDTGEVTYSDTYSSYRVVSSSEIIDPAYFSLDYKILSKTTSNPYETFKQNKLNSFKWR